MFNGFNSCFYTLFVLLTVVLIIGFSGYQWLSVVFDGGFERFFPHLVAFQGVYGGSTRV